MAAAAAARGASVIEKPTPAAYTSDPAVLARQIESVLQRYGHGNPDRLMSMIEFFEGELQMMAKALRTHKQKKGS
jgi:hypothetical protein